MASSKLAAILLPLLLCFSLLLMQAASECDSGHGCSKAMAAFQKFLLNRKVGHVLHANSNEDWELRNVPAGPNPLHHYGGSPQKPRISP